MDPLSISASICALLQTAGVVTSYLNAMKDAPKERARLTIEVYDLCGLLTRLRHRGDEVRSDNPWFKVVREVGVEKGPLNEVEVTLERLRSKLEPVGGLRKVGKILTWKFDKVDVNEMLAKIERFKTLVALALADDLFTLSRAIKDDVVEIKGGVARISTGVAQLQANHSDKELRDIADWLSPLSASVAHSDIFRRRQSGTGQWLLQSKVFRDWLVGGQQTLWCPGIPGAGKTVLASIVVDHLQTYFRGQDVAVLCIYFNYKEQIEQTACNLIGSLLKQLIADQSEASADLTSLYRDHINRRTRPELDELVSVTKSEIKSYSKVFIVVDALDECPEDNGVRQRMLTELRSLAANVNLMFTSRYLTAIEQEFHGANRLDIQAHHDDVREYVRGRISHEHRLARHVRTDPDLQENIVTTIVDKARGMFLLAQLHLDSLVSKTNRREVRRALANLPKEVDKTYDEAMKRIQIQVEDDRELAIRVLSWIAYSYRPLSTLELQYALAITPGMTAMDFDALEDVDLLTSVCAGLVVIDEESTIIHLVHYTTQEYFERTRAFHFPQAQASIAATCLTYLSFDTFDIDYDHSATEINELLTRNPLYDYAATFWGEHARGEAEAATTDIALRFFQNRRTLDWAIRVLPDSWQLFNSTTTLPRNFCAAHGSSYFGLSEVLRALTTDGVDVTKADETGRTPLHYAAANGHEASVKLLIQQRRDDIDRKESNGQTPLSLAAEYGHDAVVRLLLTYDEVDVNSSPDLYRDTPLCIAVDRGHKAVVRALLQHRDVDVNFRSWTETSPLGVAAFSGLAGIVKLLINDGRVDVNIRDEHEATPLSLAVRYGYLDVVELLIGHNDVDVNAKDFAGDTPFFIAAALDRVGVVRVLLNHDGVDVMAKNEQGDTPLSMAIWQGREAVVKVLQSHPRTAQGFDADRC